MSWDSHSFKDLSGDIHSRNLEVFGELFEYEPRLARPNRPTVADPARQKLTLKVIFTDWGRAEGEKFNNQAQTQSGIAVNMPRFEVHADAFPAGFQIMQGDFVTRCETGDRFVVRSLQRMEYNLFRVFLNEAGAPQSNFKY